MAEAIGLSSAILSLVTTACSSCQKLYSTVDGVRNAPKHIAAISKDLDDFYLVLATIQAFLDDEESFAGIVQYAQSQNLCKVLEDCILVFKDLETIISEYQAHNKEPAVRIWQRLKWTFKQSEIKDLRSDLSHCKVTLNLAISTANYYKIHATNQSTARIEEDVAAYRQELENLPQILERMGGLNAARLPQAAPHRSIDRAGIRIDYTYALRHHLDDAASVHSGIDTPSTPSFQVSVPETSSSGLSSEYHTAPMSQISNGECRQSSKKCTRILIRNVGVHQDMAFQVAREDTIGTIKSLVREKIGLKHASFELLYSSHVLNLPDKSIDEYGIPNDATLSCLSFKPNTQEIFCVMIKTTIPSSSGRVQKTLDIRAEPMTFGPKAPTDGIGITFPLSVEAHTLIDDVKEMSADLLGIKGPKDIRLVHAGKQLEDHHRLSDFGIGDDDELHLIPKLGSFVTTSNDKSPQSQEEDEARPPASEPEQIGNQVLLFWEAPFGTPWVPERRFYGPITTYTSRRQLFSSQRQYVI